MLPPRGKDGENHTISRDADPEPGGSSLCEATHPSRPTLWMLPKQWCSFGDGETQLDGVRCDPGDVDWADGRPGGGKFSRRLVPSVQTTIRNARVLETAH